MLGASVAAMEIVAMERRQEELQVLSLKKKESAIAATFELAGKVKAMRYNEKQSGFFKLLLMKQAKEAKEYRDQHDMSWEQFCEYCGENRRWVDEQLAKIKDLKVEFLEAFLRFSDFDFHKIKYLGEAASGGLLRISGNSIIYGDEEIPVVTERADDVKALFEKIEADLKAKIDDAQAEARAQKKLVKSKEDVITKQEKDLRKFEKRAEGKGLSPEEDAFNDQVEEFQTQFTGYITRILPDRIEELQNSATVTPQMRARYLTLLEWMYMQVKAARDTAEERFGADLKDSEWKQPD